MLNRVLLRAGSVLISITAAACSQEPNGGGVQVRKSDMSKSSRGAQIYAQNCQPCHREDGAGLAAVYPGLQRSAAVSGDPIQLAQWILSQKRPASIPAGHYSTRMPLFQWLKDEDAAALLTYIRANFGNFSAPVDAASVARARQN